jgi:hypothetical protein
MWGFIIAWPQGLVTIHVNILSMYKHVQGRTPFFTPARFKSCLFFKFLLIRNAITSEKIKYRMVKPLEFRTSVFFNRWRCYFHFGFMMFSTQANSWQKRPLHRRNNKLKKMDSIKKKALKMALSSIVCTSKKNSVLNIYEVYILIFYNGHDIFWKE